MKSYTVEFKDQIVKEIQEVGNLSLVCRKHGLQLSTVHGWVHKVTHKDEIAENI